MEMETILVETSAAWRCHTPSELTDILDLQSNFYCIVFRNCYKEVFMSSVFEVDPASSGMAFSGY